MTLCVELSTSEDRQRIPQTKRIYIPLDVLSDPLNGEMIIKICRFHRLNNRITKLRITVRMIEINTEEAKGTKQLTLSP